jgi:hypothetical protein
MRAGDPYFLSYRQYSLRISSSATIKRYQFCASSAFDFLVRSNIQLQIVVQETPRRFTKSLIDAFKGSFARSLL